MGGMASSSGLPTDVAPSVRYKKFVAHMRLHEVLNNLLYSTKNVHKFSLLFGNTHAVLRRAKPMTREPRLCGAKKGHRGYI